MYQKFKQYFEISPREFKGMTALIVLIISAFVLPFVCEKLTDQPLKISIQTLEPKIVAIDKATENATYSKYDLTKKNAEHPVQLFKFNPNNLSISDWMKLGLTEKQAHSIKNYEAKGGKFRSRADVKKMYAISVDTYLALEPYIQIPIEMALPVNINSSENTAIQSKKKISESVLIDINMADSLLLMTIKGVGPAFASRIIKYRARLGGFYAKSQIKEVYGIDSLKYEQISPQIYVSQILLKQININQCTFEEVKNFPYLSYKQMNAMINYRKQHGNFKSIDDLNKIAIFSPEIILKISPYFSL